MTTIYIIPLKPRAQQLQVDVAGVQYYMRLLYVDVPSGEGGWTLDLANASGAILLAGLPLVTGVDLLQPYEYLGVGARLFVVTPGAPAVVPAYADLGVRSYLCWTTDLTYTGFAPPVTLTSQFAETPLSVLADDTGHRLTTDQGELITRLS